MKKAKRLFCHQYGSAHGSGFLSSLRKQQLRNTGTGQRQHRRRCRQVTALQIVLRTAA